MYLQKGLMFHLYTVGFRYPEIPDNETPDSLIR